ncbi:MAG: ABC transporter permease [Candidatus Glassbacteria bacterium]
MKRIEIKESMMIALEAVATHKLRSLLTILGIVIGIVSVVGMVSLVQGLNASMARQIQALGSNVIYVTKLAPGMHVGRPSLEERRRPPITYEDAKAVKENVKTAKAVSAENYFYGDTKVRYKENEASSPPIAGVMPDYPEVRDVSLARGRFITEGDDIHGLKVCVLGSKPAEALFGSEEPLGKNITIEGRTFRVIGVLEEQGKFLNRDRDDIILLPYRTYAHLHPEEEELLLVVKPKSPELIGKCMDEITIFLRLHRGVPPDAPNNFHLSTQDSLNEIYKQVTSGIYIAMIVISSIGLVVGGVGVMNIMLVSVKERTREIGLRKAIGARKVDILWQFLIEAMSLTGLGGVIGIGLGVLVSILVNSVSPLPSQVSFLWIVIAMGVSVSVGLFFGIYPASKAASLDPIEALRYE